jgi:hypothetical protein
MNNTTDINDYYKIIAQIDETTLTTDSNYTEYYNTFDSVCLCIFGTFIVLCILCDSINYITEIRLNQIYQGYYKHFIKYDYMILRYKKLIIKQRRKIQNLQKLKRKEQLEIEKKELIELKQEIKNTYTWRTYFNRKMLKILIVMKNEK